MHKIILGIDAKNDVIGIQSYIGNKSLLAAVKILSSIQKTLKYLEMFPEIGKPLDDDLREIVETKYKYRIIYTVVDENEILILAIFKNKDIY